MPLPLWRDTRRAWNCGGVLRGPPPPPLVVPQPARPQGHRSPRSGPAGPALGRCRRSSRVTSACRRGRNSAPTGPGTTTARPRRSDGSPWCDSQSRAQPNARPGVPPRAPPSQNRKKDHAYIRSKPVANFSFAIQRLQSQLSGHRRRDDSGRSSSRSSSPMPPSPST